MSELFIDSWPISRWISGRLTRARARAAAKVCRRSWTRRRGIFKSRQAATSSRRIQLSEYSGSPCPLSNTLDPDRGSRSSHSRSRGLIGMVRTPLFLDLRILIYRRIRPERECRQLLHQLPYRASFLPPLIAPIIASARCGCTCDHRPSASLDSLLFFSKSPNLRLEYSA